MTDWRKLPTEELAKIATKHYIEAYGKAMSDFTTWGRETLIMLLNNLDNYQHMLNKHFSDEESG